MRVLAQRQQASKTPLIPFDTIDAPSQRLYVVAFYIALTAWRLYNAYKVSDELDSSWQFLKWCGMDAAFFVALPAFQIPWLEFSFVTTITLWLLHAIANAFLMYRIPIPILAWLAALSKYFYDRELSISEQRVKPYDITHNSSIILGKQIIHILPEGSAIFNPEKLSFCLDSSTPSVELPLVINQTSPISIQLTRFDLDTNEEQQIVISGKQARHLKRQADRGFAKTDTKTPRTLQYQVSKTGLYRLERVIDESKLDVRRRSFDVAVVKCPSAIVTTASDHGCTGDLSRVSLDVNGVPPFKVKYSKRINNQPASLITQSIQPSSDEEPSNIVMDPHQPQMGWTQSTTTTFEINEALSKNGSWTYTVEAVEDGLGNKVAYDSDYEKEMIRTHRMGSLTVHHRPVVDLIRCDPSHPLRVAKDTAVNLPVRVRPIGQLPSPDWPLKLKYTFISDDGSVVPIVQDQVHEMTGERALPRIFEAGRYSLQSVSSQFCPGEVVEPSSCPLYNPPRPSLTLDAEDIVDKCAGNPIGMNVNLDFVGTPPFKIRYTVTHRGMATPKVAQFDSLRGQLEFKERAAGSYIYQILEIEDEVYSPISLKDQGLILKQDIKPPASAMFTDSTAVAKACFGGGVGKTVKLVGEGPWELDYEVVHAGKRRKERKHAEQDLVDIELPSLDGGEHTIVLTGVQDKSKCKTSLKEERKIEVRPEQPRAAFGDIEGKRSILALQGKAVQLPLRLQGLSPWTVEVKNLETESRTQHKFQNPNGVVSVDKPGTYEIVSVRDSCPGFVDPTANTFNVAWIARPTLAIADNQVHKEGTTTYRKAAVCEGDESHLALALSGNRPYHLKYMQRFEPVKGPAAISNRPLALAGNSASLSLDTNKAGEYSYVFNELSDERYGHDKHYFHPLTVKQKVYAPPVAKFTSPGKTYGYCKDDSFDSQPSTESIPIAFTGEAPFSLEIAITHHGATARPEIVRLNDIPSNTYTYSLPRSSLDLGTHTLSIRSLTDSRGCQNILESDSSAIRISVSSPPTIIPLESQTDFCVGEHVSFSLSGQPPFEVFYSFQGKERRANVRSTEFKRIAESPGDFVVTGVSDAAMGSGKCKATKNITKNIHAYPSVKISQGKTQISDIHEGGEVDIVFEFTGTPPFEFTWTRSENAKKGQQEKVLETRHDKSDDFKKTVRASEEGVYQVVAIKDRWCAYTQPGYAVGKGNKLLTY